MAKCKKDLFNNRFFDLYLFYASAHFQEGESIKMIV